VSLSPIWRSCRLRIRTALGSCTRYISPSILIGPTRIRIPYPRRRPSFAEYLRQIEQPRLCRRLSCGPAEDRLVGFCGSLGLRSPDYRGWGIATAMEARMIERARAQRQESLIVRPPTRRLRAVYAKLGYERSSARCG